VGELKFAIMVSLLAKTIEEFYPDSYFRLKARKYRGKW
jgi:hypothetical protein